MSREDVEVVRRLFAAVDAEDWEAALGSFAPEVEWSPLEGNFRGLQGVLLQSKARPNGKSRNRHLAKFQ